MSATIPVSMLSSGGCHKPLSIDHVEFPFHSTHWRSTDVAADLVPPPSNPPASPPPFPPGMSLRDLFAAFAMCGLMQLIPDVDDFTADAVADEAYRHADAMLRRRSQPAQVIH